MATTVVLFTDTNLRLEDHVALDAAATRGAIVPLFVLDTEAPPSETLGGAAKWWLHHSLMALSKALAAKGTPLILAKGALDTEVERVIRQSGADALYLSRQYSPHMRSVEKAIYDRLTEAGVAVKRFAGHVMYEPDLVRTGADKPYTVFSPFWKKCRASEPAGDPLAAPLVLMPSTQTPASLPIEALDLLPKIPWDTGFYSVWKPGRAGAEARLDEFLTTGLGAYDGRRDRPDMAGTSALSPHIRFGEISTREIRARVEALAAQNASLQVGAEHYVRELGWREFSYHLLFNFPHLPVKPLREQFAHFPWSHSETAADITWLTKWQRGETGYPIVDAGMRQLYETGWMHNRVRMIVASFLVKELLWHWLDGLSWFHDCLVDADIASNAASWQWAAGSGADAAPYFRIFNPILQGEKFDPKGDYVRTYVPELANCPTKYIHKPFEAPGMDLIANGIQLGKSYPNPVVDRVKARDRALAALQESKAALGRLKAS